MTDEPVLTSSWCTNWGAFNTPRLWSMVMNEDDTAGRSQVTAWRSLAGSVTSQRQALVTARADLVAAWPPDQNESSAAFVAELDTLIGRLDTASADAETTANGLNNILNAIQTAKTTIQPLWEKYKDKSSDLVPSWWDGAEDEIDEQARTAMINAERTVEDSVALLKVPEPYKLDVQKPKGGSDDPYPPGGDGTGSSSGNGGGSGRAGGSGGGIDAPVPHDPVPPLPGQDATVPDGGGAGAGGGAGSVGGISGGGPDLAGVITPGQPPIPGAGGAIGLPGGGGGGAPAPITGGGGGSINPLMPGLMPTGGGGGTIPPGGRGLRPGARPAGSASRLPSSGVIGEPAGGLGGRGGMAPGGAGGRGGMAPGGAAGRAGGRSRTGRGGILGAEGEGAGGRGVAGKGGRVPRPSWLSDDPVGPNRNAGSATGMAGAPGRGNRRARGEDDTIGFDPDNPWEVAEGVDPVIAPAPDTARHDPGPNVIGWNG